MFDWCNTARNNWWQRSMSVHKIWVHIHIDCIFSLHREREMKQTTYYLMIPTGLSSVPCGLTITHMNNTWISTVHCKNRKCIRNIERWLAWPNTRPTHFEYMTRGENKTHFDPRWWAPKKSINLTNLVVQTMHVIAFICLVSVRIVR